MIDGTGRIASAEKSGLLPAGLSLAICAIACITTLAITLPGGYLRLQSGEECLFGALLLGPYSVLGLFAWWRRGSLIKSVTLLLLTSLLAATGLWILANEATDYSAVLVESARGPDYLRDRYQRMGLFLVPAVQWMACLSIGTVLLISVGWEALSTRKALTDCLRSKR